MESFHTQGSSSGVETREQFEGARRHPTLIKPLSQT